MTPNKVKAAKKNLWFLTASMTSLPTLLFFYLSLSDHFTVTLENVRAVWPSCETFLPNLIFPYCLSLLLLSHHKMSILFGQAMRPSFLTIFFPTIYCFTVPPQNIRAVCQSYNYFFTSLIFPSHSPLIPLSHYKTIHTLWWIYDNFLTNPNMSLSLPIHSTHTTKASTLFGGAFLVSSCCTMRFLHPGLYFALFVSFLQPPSTLQPCSPL